jgi:hypothetical protein
MSIAAIEREAAWLGGDERAAKALVMENDGLHNGHEITGRAIEAVEAEDQGRDAA